MIAELLSKEGYDCHLQKTTRDGGKDIIAIKTDEVASSILYVECKLYNSQNKVSIDVVKKLHSTIINDKVNKGIIATTSYFTLPSKEFIERNKWLLEGKNIDEINHWIDLYVSKLDKDKNYWNQNEVQNYSDQDCESELDDSCF